MNAVGDLPLFGGEAADVVSGDGDYVWFDALRAAARAKIGAPAAWEWCVAKVLHPTTDILLEGGVPVGGRTGRRRWDGVRLQTVVVTRAEQDAACAAFEAVTGKCHRCAGSGRTLKSVSVTDGRTYRTCDRCGGDGRAEVAA